MSWNRGGWWVVVVLGCACGAGARQRLEVRGSDLSGTYVHLDVMVGGQPVEDARVEIDGQVIPFVGDRYSGELATPVDAGGTLSLEVSRGGLTVSGSGRVPEAPAVTAPDSGTYVSSGEDLVVRWTSATSPDTFVVFAQWSCGHDCGTGASFEAPGSARTLTLPAGALPVGPVELTVYAYNDGQLTGDYAPPSSYAGMNIRGESQGVALTVGTTPGRSVSGVVSGLVSSAGALLELACLDTPTRTVTAAQDGAYAFDGLPPVSCTLTPRGDGYSFDPPGVVLPATSGDRTGVSFLARGLLQVRGSIIDASVANVDVRHAGEPVEDAVVRVNGQLLSWIPAPGIYHADWPTPLSPGDAVSLEVTTTWASVTGAAVLPEAPVLVAPAPGPISPASAVIVRWTSATSPDGFVVRVDGWPDPSTGMGQSFTAPGSARELTVPADQLPSGSLRIFVQAVNDGQLTGAYDPYTPDTIFGPGMNVISESPEVWVSR